MGELRPSGERKYHLGDLPPETPLRALVAATKARWTRIEYRHTKPRTPRTNGMVERFNGRVGSEVLGITVHCHRDLERLLRGFDAAYNARRRRVLDGKTPDRVVAERIEAEPELARATPHGRAGPCDVTKARLVAETANEVSQPDS